MDTIDASMESMLEMFIFETTGLLEQLDEILLSSEKDGSFSEDSINEIFRIMHTVKGSAAMMGLETLSTVAHKVEDMFFIIREDPTIIDEHSTTLFDILFRSSDFMRGELDKIQEGGSGAYEAANADELIEQILKQKAILSGEEVGDTDASKENGEKSGQDDKFDKMYEVKVFFEDGCQMENIRAVMLINNIKDWCDEIYYMPEDIETNPKTCKTIIENGFDIFFTPAKTANDVFKAIETSINVKSYETISEPNKKEEKVSDAPKADDKKETKKEETKKNFVKSEQQKKKEKINKKINNSRPAKQNLISVNLTKLDQLMDIVGEIVITESMVASSPDLKGLDLDNFNKATRQLRKLTDTLQDTVMSIRMVEIAGVLQKMNRLVRDMNKKLGKDCVFETEGESTEVDKSIIDALSDPFMHLIRNSMDHGIESTEDRIRAGKNPQGTIGIYAQSAAGEITIIVADDGRGLDPQVILDKAKRKGLLTKPEDKYTESEIYNLIMLPGFSTNEQVTEYSGRGVGMDVVCKNIEQVGGRISVQSELGKGMRTIIKIPLTLAIVDGMDINVGNTIFTLPINSIRQTFKVSDDYKIIKDNEGAEMIIARGECFPIIRLHNIYDIKTEKTDFKDGIMVLIEAGSKSACIFADSLIGEQQVVVKPFPQYLSQFNIKQKGLAGCTILGDGNISLIIDANTIMDQF